MIKKYSQLQYISAATKEQINSVAKKLGLTSEKVVNLASEVDPTKRYEVWLLKQMRFGNIILPEDKDSVQNTLKNFEQLNKRSQLKFKNINQYSNIADLKNEMEQIMPRELEDTYDYHIHEYLQLPGVDMFAQSTEYIILEVSNAESLTKFGDSTDWCTRHIENARNYLAEGNQYVVFKKQGNKVIKFAQFANNLSQFQDIKNNPMHKIDTSLGQLMLENVDISSFEDIDEFFTEFVIELKKIAPDLKIPDGYINTYIEELQGMYVDDIDWALLAKIDLSLRDILFTHPDIEDDIYGQIEHVKIYLEYSDNVPRWPKLESFIPDALQESVEAGFGVADVKEIILLYLSKVEKFGRWKEMDNHILDSSLYRGNPFNYTALLKYIQWNDVANNLKWPEFEEFIISELFDIDLDYMSQKYSITLAMEYWLLATPKGSRWEDLEKFLRSHPAVNYYAPRPHLGTGISPLAHYLEHAQLEEFKDLAES